MGASGWEYRVAFTGSLAETFVAAQQEVLASGSFIWPWESIDPDYVSEVVPRPTSLAALAEAKQFEEFWDEGTHTILDVERIWAEGDEGDFGAIRPLTAAELIANFGAEHPSVAEFDRVHRSGPSGPLADLMGQKWSGRIMAIYADAVPAEVYIWGWSGD